MSRILSPSLTTVTRVCVALLTPTIASACAGGSDKADAVSSDARIPTVMISGVVRDALQQPVSGASVTTLEAPDSSSETGQDGRWVLEVPRGADVTVAATSTGFAPTYAHPVQFWTDQEYLDLKMITSSEYLEFGKFATLEDGTAVFFVGTRSATGCSSEGGHIRTEPQMGTVVYADAAVSPDPKLTALGLLGSAYVIGVTGTTTPVVSGVGICEQDPFPVETGATSSMIFTGNVDAKPGGFHLVSVFIH